MPSISILLPVFNAAPFLKECIESLIDQSESDWELIAVDDFSTDKSYALLQKYAVEDKRISVFKNQEKGIIAALRLAYQKAQGTYISRMDADDKMSPDKLRLMKETLQSAGAGYLATGLVKYFADRPLGAGYLRYEQWLNTLTTDSLNFSEIYKECVIPSPCWMLHRSDLDKCGAFLPDTYPEDYDLCFRFYENRLKVIGIKKVLHYWRDHSTRTSRNDETYANNQYLALKVPYFLKLDYKSEQPLVLWGAGKKGKIIARMLEQAGVYFYWVCNTPSKWGHKLYSTIMNSPEVVTDLENPHFIIAVAAPEGQVEILDFMRQENIPESDYFFFC